METLQETPPEIRRDSKGRWLKGNPAGPGRQKGYRQKLQTLAISQVSAQDVRAAYQLMWRYIRRGDKDFLKFFFTYFVGPIEPDQLEIINNTSSQSPEEVRQEFYATLNRNQNQGN